ncbi:hypothetical protein TNCV_4269371 [Trichonephila clavipes]|nr:hypothetical protein TNCV_4269371 [Trichonephila clavipes]
MEGLEEETSDSGHSSIVAGKNYTWKIHLGIVLRLENVRMASKVNCEVAAIRDISRSCLDPNDFAVLNCIVKGHVSLSPPSLRLRLCLRFTLFAT